MGIKGFYFSLDALMGLMVIGLGATLITSTASISEGVTGDRVEFDNYSGQAIDISYLMLEEDFQAVESTVEDYQVHRGEADSIGEALHILHDRDEAEAEELAEEYLETFEYSSGLQIEGEEIVEFDSNIQSSTSFKVPGEESPKRFTVVVGR